MTRFELIVTILCIKLYANNATPTTSPTDQTPQNAYELYDSTQMSEEFDPIIEQQPLPAYHDIILTNDKEYYIPQTLVTVSAKRTSQQTNNNEEEVIMSGENYSSDNEEKQTSTAPILSENTNNHITTIILDDSKISDLLHDEKVENSSSQTFNADLDSDTMPLETFETAAANKNSKMFIPVDEYDTADVQILPVYIENALQSSEQLISRRNDTDDNDDDGHNSSIDNIENEDSDLEFNASETTTITEEQSTNIPTTSTSTQIIYKKAKSIPTTTTILTTTSTTTARPITTTRSHIYKFSADEILRKFLEDSYIRSPLAVLIDTSSNSLRKSKRLWKAALRPNSAVDIVLVAYNATGVGVTYNFKNTRTMEAGLDSVQESNVFDADLVGNGGGNGGSAFYGILRASELIPYDSAIFVSTDSIPADVNLAQYAGITLLKKRIRLYLIWFGPQSFDDNQSIGQNNEGGILGEVALRSGGEILRVTEEAFGPNGDLGLITLFLSNDIQGVQELEIPVDTTASNLQLNFHGNVETATLDTPLSAVGGNKYSINLWNKYDVESFSPGSIQLCVPSINNDTNMMIMVRLNVKNEIYKGDYVLKTTSSTELDWYGVNAVVVKNVETLNENEENAELNENEFFENISWNVMKQLRSARLSSEDENPYNSQSTIVFPDENIETIDLLSTNSTNEEEIMGRNTLQAITKIDIGSQSQLLAAPGQTVSIYYEVTNLREEPTFHIFQVIDELRYLRSLNPQSLWLAPGQFATVVVTAIIPPNAEIGTKDKITFSTQGISSVMQAATITVTSPQSNNMDVRRPYVWWGYGSRCSWQTSEGSCAQSVWSLEVTAQDQESGILRIQSNPRGIIVRTPFIAGTTNLVKATYTSSCCTTKVTITVFDVAGNQKIITADVREYWLDEASIAAVVLGSILFVLICAIIIGLIVWCCRRKKSREFAVYRSRPEREREQPVNTRRERHS